MVKRGMLDHCKNGPLYWIDTADSQPCIGTGGIAAWQMTAYGELLCHEGSGSVALVPPDVLWISVNIKWQRLCMLPCGPSITNKHIVCNLALRVAHSFSYPSPLLPPGKIFHSGLPHKAINPIEMAMDAVLAIQKRFYTDFGPHPLEAK
jgi:hypothetical protein